MLLWEEPLVQPAMATNRVALSLANSTAAADEFSVDCRGPDYRILVRLANDSASHQAWKCKTNAPSRWSVKPNGGVLNPGEAVEVKFKLCSGHTMEGLESDRHLILNAPISVGEAARLREERRWRPRRRRSSSGARSSRGTLCVVYFD